MNLLCIDTSTRNLSLAVARNGKVLRFRNACLSRPLDLSIMPSIKRILDQAGVPMRRIDGFAVGLGPGSFTGLRVGLSTVKGLAYGTGKPVVGVPSLDILAMNARGNAQVCTVCDAKRSLVYACVYENEGLTLKRKSDYVLADIADVLKGIKGEVTFVGDGIELYRNDIEKARGIVPKYLNEKDMFPQARRMVPLVVKQLKEGKGDDIDKMVPLYLYPDHCQIKNKKEDGRKK